MTYFFINRSTNTLPEHKTYDEDNDEADGDAEDQEQEVEEQLVNEPATGGKLEDHLVQSPHRTRSSLEEDKWSDELVQGLSQLVKEGSIEVKEHAVTALFNITKLSTSVLMRVLSIYLC